MDTVAADCEVTEVLEVDGATYLKAVLVLAVELVDQVTPTFICSCRMWVFFRF